MNTSKLWDATLDIIKTKVSKISYDTWFSDSKLHEIKDNKAIVIVQMHIQKKNLKENYNDLIEEVFTEVSGSNFKFEYLLEEEIENNIEMFKRREIEWDDELGWFREVDNDDKELDSFYDDFDYEIT